MSNTGTKYVPPSAEKQRVNRVAGEKAQPPAAVDKNKEPLPEVAEGEKRELVERIASSYVFAGSPALQSFLRFIARNAIAGTIENIKEQRIGSEVLGRKPDYNPAEDNIVRVRAHELRQRLAKYFDTVGVQERVVVIVPRGSYVPVFRLRTSTSESLPPNPAELPDPQPAAGTSKRLLPSFWGGWITSALLATALVAEVIVNPAGTQTAGSNPMLKSESARDFWSQLVPPHGPELIIVAADSTFALWQDMTSSSLNLGEYLGRRQFIVSSEDQKLREVAARRLTSPADLNLAVRLTELSLAFGGRVRAQYARNLNLHELKANNVVLIGSRRSNPWVELFEPRMNFVLDRDPTSGAPAFVNKHPRLGEPYSFSIPNMMDADGSEEKEMNSYAHVALVSNLSSTGNVLILEGLNMEGTEAAGEFVANAAGLSNLLHALGHQPGKPVQPFEAVLNLTSVPGGFANTKVIAYRSIAR